MSGEGPVTADGARGLDAAAQGRPDAAADGFVIGELSRRTGVTVRSLRAYQSRGLLPPPVVRGRTGYYDESHAARVRLVQDLQAEGLKLDGIARLLDGGSDEQLLAFTRSVRDMFGEPADPVVTTLDDLVRRFRVGADGPSVLARAVRMRLLRDLGDGTYEELAPALLAAGELAIERLGLGAAEALDVVARLRKHADGVAEVYVDLFVARVWQPFVEAGHPAEEWPRVRDSLHELRGLALAALDSAFELVMGERVDRTLARELTRGRPRGRRG